MTLHTFRCSADKTLYLACETIDVPEKAKSLCKGEWVPFKQLEDTGEELVGLPTGALLAAAIKKDGYHVFRAGFNMRETIIPSKK